MVEQYLTYSPEQKAEASGSMDRRTLETVFGDGLPASLIYHEVQRQKEAGEWQWSRLDVTDEVKEKFGAIQNLSPEEFAQYRKEVKEAYEKLVAAA